MGGLASLVDAIWRVPIPTAPTPGHVHREGFGLTVLALALRLEHVGRISETLTLVDSTHLSRAVTVTVDLSTLTDQQRDALRAGDRAAVSVPIARLPRRDLASVVVRDAAGRVLPRSPRVETGRSLAAGLHRTFQMLLEADPQTDRPGSAPHRVRTDLNRAGWLIRAAITSLVEDGPAGTRRVPGPSAPGAPVPALPSSDRVTRSSQIRRAAEEAVCALFDERDPFPTLLEIASTEHVLMAEVPDGASNVYLTYEAPLMPALNARGATQWARRIARGAIDEFTVEYRTVIPRAVESYHVTIEVPEQITVRRFFLTSDVDTPALDVLTADMTAVARDYTALAAAPKLLELELQSIASRLAEFGRRRWADLGLVADGRPAQDGPDGEVTAAELLTRSPRLVSNLAVFAGRYEADEFRKLGGDPEGALDASTLDTVAAAVREARVDQDVVPDNDPRENAGHAHWRRRPFGADRDATEPVTVAVHATLVDDPPSLASNVWKILLGILALVLGARLLLFPGSLPFGAGVGGRSVVDDPNRTLDSADALVTVLLLVPGLLLARLDLPGRSSVLGTLRRVPQYVAYTAVFVAAALALVVATAEARLLDTAMEVAVLVLLLLLVVVLGNEAVKARRRRVRVPRVVTTPPWLVAETVGGSGAPSRPTVTFSTVEVSEERR